MFRALDEAALQRLDDDALIAYMLEARCAGDPSAGLALAILASGYWDNVERRVRMKVPPADVEDLTGDVIVDALASAFDGQSLGEFRAWLNTITRRAIADYYRRGPGRIKYGDEPAAEPVAPSETGAVELRDALERALAALRPDHRRVVELVLFEGMPAADAAREVEGMTAANVYKIVSRFRESLRGELEAGGDTG